MSRRDVLNSLVISFSSIYYLSSVMVYAKNRTPTKIHNWTTTKNENENEKESNHKESIWCITIFHLELTNCIVSNRVMSIFMDCSITCSQILMIFSPFTVFFHSYFPLFYYFLIPWKNLFLPSIHSWFLTSSYEF